ncbi:MAG: hypothetical protein Q7J48_05955 [Nocardioides sp.]|nr:hypothetical protein [Nocardioides sp.]
MSPIVLVPARAAAVSAALVLGLATAAVPAYADGSTPSTPVPSAQPSAQPSARPSARPSAEETTGGHSHDDSEHGTTPSEPAEESGGGEPDEGHDEGHGEHAPPAEPTDRPRAWAFGGFAVVNGVALAYAAWLRRRTAPDRNRRNAARSAAQTREGSTR